MSDSIEIANTETPLFDVEIVAEGRKLSPRSIEELEAWLERERQFWAWITEARNDDPQVKPVANEVGYRSGEIANALSACKATPAEDRKKFIDQLRSNLEERFSSRRVPTSESPDAQFFADLSRTDKVVAAHALWAYLGKEQLPTARVQRALQGQILGTLYRYRHALDIVPTQAHEAAWAQLQSRVSGEHEALRRDAGKLSDAYRKTSEDIHELHAKQGKAFDEAQTARADEFTKLTGGHATKMENIETTFKHKLSLHSAVEYLKAKADQHSTTARNAGIAAAAVGAAFVGLAVYIGTQVFTTSPVPVPQIAIAVLAATLVFWLLRILVRVLLSNLHLETDMRARSTFVHTYLALLAEGGGVQDEDRALVIGLVFRPISDGLVRDDATPPGLWDLVTKNLSGRN